MRINWFFGILLIIASGIYSCTPKAVSTSTSGYTEDLSAFRPKPQVLTKDTNTVISEEFVYDKGPYTRPENDLSEELTLALDNIAAENRNKPYSVFTIQVYTGRNKEEANDAKQKVYRYLPDASPAVEYKQPKYLVNVGEFEDRLDAYETFEKLKKVFPGAMLVQEKKYFK